MPLKEENKSTWTRHFEEIARFVRGLHHVNPIPDASTTPVPKKSKKDLRVVSGPRKKGSVTIHC
jgi:hypothetical protein